MSESMNAAQENFRRQLLTSVSALALLASIYGTREVRAEDVDHPTVWIEVGGAFDQISAGNNFWSPPNLAPPISNPQPLPFGKLPIIGFDADLKLSFTPENSNWIYSASIRYGRAQHGPKSSHDQSYKFIDYPTGISGRPRYHLTNYDFSDAAQQSHSTHATIDFMAGKDIGLGFFGGNSVVSAGIRIAKLNESTKGQLTAIITPQIRYDYSELSHKAEFLAAHSFNGIGPSVSWDVSAPLLGSQSDGVSMDWGANAAILFGRQKAIASLRTENLRYYRPGNYPGYTAFPPKVLSQSTQAPARARIAVVPNLGGFAGLSWHLPNVKVSFGYRGDFFFGAIDGGLLTSQKETRGFYGPFANVSIGIGG
ncbi:MAG TPA: hypothetical protein VIJ62_00470 [Rhizomicrobium sp.]